MVLHVDQSDLDDPLAAHAGISASADNFIRHFNVGRVFNLSGAVPRLGADVPRWFGESIAFWDGETLVTRTSNVIP